MEGNKLGLTVNEVITGQVYRHYKNKQLYRVIATALLEATHEPLVIYECLYPNDLAQIWARPHADFTAVLNVSGYEGPRFALVSNT